MNKIIKVVSVIIIVVAIIVALIFLGMGKDKEAKEDKINEPMSLSQEYSDSDFYARNIKCDLLKEKEILYYDGEILILDDYTIYETAFNSDKVYSNNLQYKQIDLGIQVKRIHLNKTSYPRPKIYLENIDNKFYNFSTSEYVDQSTFGLILKDENIKISIRDMRNLRENRYIVVKNDGQVYSQVYYAGKVKEETVLLSNQDYGHITDIAINDRWEVTRIVSDRGIFWLKEIQTEESSKYIDVEPEYKFVLSDTYTKYKDDILYMNSEFIFTTDNNILKTDMLCK